MAGYSVQWILLASALVGCVQTVTNEIDKTHSLEEIERFYQLYEFSAVEPAEKADEPLLLRLDRGFLKPERLRDILKGYRDQGEKILDRTVKMLVEMCEPSLKNCSYEGFERVIKIGNEFKETIPNLYEYSQYCLSTVLRDFCRDNAAKVVQDLGGKVNERTKSLVQRLLEPLRDLGKIDNEDIVEAYFNIRGNVDSLEDNKNSLQIFNNALFLHYIEVLGKTAAGPKGEMSRPEMTVFGKLGNFLGFRPKDEVLITSWDTLDRIVERFIHPVSSQIEERFYAEASRELKSKLLGESLKPERLIAILSEYEHKDVKICNDTVGELVEMWQESPTKCNYEAFERILSVEDECKKEVPKLFQYRRHCALVRLETYCREQSDQVVPDLKEAVEEEDMELVSSILESLPKAEALDRVSASELDANIAQAYNQVKKSEYTKDVLSLSEEKDFLARVKRALFLRYVQVSAASRAASEVSISASGRDNLSIIFERFIYSVSTQIKEQMYAKASEALKIQLDVEYGSIANETVREMFREYEHKEVKIYDITVAEFVEMCEPSLNHCMYAAFDNILTTPDECKLDHPRLFEYRKYCAKTIVKSYCRENVDKMMKLLLATLSVEDKLVAFFYKKIYDTCKDRVFNRMGIFTHDFCKEQAVGKLMVFTYKRGLTHTKGFTYKKELAELLEAKFIPFRKKICTVMHEFAEFSTQLSYSLDFDKDTLKGDILDIAYAAVLATNTLECRYFRM